MEQQLEQPSDEQLAAWAMEQAEEANVKMHREFEQAEADRQELERKAREQEERDLLEKKKQDDRRAAQRKSAWAFSQDRVAWDKWWRASAASTFREPLDLARLPSEAARRAAENFMELLREPTKPTEAECAADSSTPDYLARVEEWKAAMCRNRYFFGPSGSGKTRLAWEIVRLGSRPSREGRDTPIPEWGPTTFGFGAEYKWPIRVATASMILGQVSVLRGKGLDGWLDEWSKPKLLVLDDLGHRLTPAGADALLELLRARLEDKWLTTIFTSNFSLPALLSRWRDHEARETLLAIERRIREFCAPLAFGGEPDATATGVAPPPRRHKGKSRTGNWQRRATGTA